MACSPAAEGTDSTSDSSNITTAEVASIVGYRYQTTIPINDAAIRAGAGIQFEHKAQIMGFALKASETSPEKGSVRLQTMQPDRMIGRMIGDTRFVMPNTEVGQYYTWGKNNITLMIDSTSETNSLSGKTLARTFKVVDGGRAVELQGVRFERVSTGDCAAVCAEAASPSKERAYDFNQWRGETYTCAGSGTTNDPYRTCNCTSRQQIVCTGVEVCKVNDVGRMVGPTGAAKIAADPKCAATDPPRSRADHCAYEPACISTEEASSPNGLWRQDYALPRWDWAPF